MNTERKMKIAVIFHDSDLYSGATRSLVDILDKIIENNLIDVVAVFPNKSGTAIDYLKGRGIDIIYSSYSQARVVLNENILRYFIALPIRILRQVIGKFNAKFIISRKLKELGVTGIYTNTSTILVGAYIKKVIDVKHIWHFREFSEEDQNKTMLFGRKHFYNLVNNYTDEVIVLSKAMQKKYSRYIEGNLIKVVYNDISPVYINKKNDLISKSDKTFNILVAGQVKPEKGQEQAIKAIEILRKKNYNINLFIAGSGPKEYLSKLEKYVESNGLTEHIKFLGQVRDLNKLRSEMNVGIVPSKFEAFGRVTVEGMLSCMTMIGANRGGTVELIEDNKTGLIYEWGDVTELSQKIQYLYENREYCTKLAMNGFNHAINFTKGNCALHIEKSFLNNKNRVDKESRI